MHEWGIPFHVIENEWTQRQFDAMCERLAERMKKQSRGHERGNSGVTRMRYKDAITQGLF